MKQIATIVIVLLGLGNHGASLASGSYVPEKICPQPNYTLECDVLVENAVAKDIPGVIERSGPVLQIHARNGKIVEKKNASPEIREAESWKLWACDYLPESGFVRLCYRLWESSKTEFINIRSGQVVAMAGWPIYSPSRGSVLMVDGYGGEIYSLEIWRFGTNGLQKEFRLESPPGEGWEVPRWKEEGKIETNPGSRASGQRYTLIKEPTGWILRAQ